MIDAHAHLIDSKYKYQEIVDSMKQDRLEAIVTIGTGLSDSRKNIKLAGEYDAVFATVGIHPEYADSVTDEKLAAVDALAGQNKVVAIGEIGLDYHYNVNAEQIEKQKEVFVAQLGLAKKHNLPVVIHCRDAADDVLAILREYKDNLPPRIVMHCYSEGAKYAKAFEELGCFFSFTGNITYKKSERDFLKDLPKDKIMVETDAPWLAPEPLRGTTNYPKNVWLTAQKVADILEMPLEKFDKLATSNTKRFYNLP